jgi:hypothetical protein
MMDGWGWKSQGFRREPKIGPWIIVVIGVEEANLCGHPHAETLAR